MGPQDEEYKGQGVPEILSKIKNQGTNNQPNISDISSYYPQGFQPQAQKQGGNPFTPNGTDLSGQVTNPGAMSLEAQYPVYSNPYTGNIYKGSYSGSIVGNIPIFVDSSLPSFAVSDEREKQLQMAAAAKSKEIQAMQDDLYKTPQLKNAPDQPEMNDIYLNGIDKWKQLHGGDVKSMLQNPQFHKWREDVRTAGRINDAAYDQYAAMGKDLDEGKKYFSPETREAYKGFLSGAANLGDPTHNDSQNFTAKAFKLNQSYDLDHAVDDALKSYHQQVIESDPTKKSMGIYDIIKTEKETNKDRNPIIALGKNLYENKYKGTGTFSEQQVIDRVENALQYSKENQVSSHANQFAPKNDASAATENYNYNQKETNRDVSLYGARTGTKTANDISKTTMSSVYKLSAADQGKTLSLPIDNDKMKFTDGTSIGKTGYVKGNVSDIGVIKVFKPGVKIRSHGPDGKVIMKDVGGMPVDKTIQNEPNYVDNPASYTNVAGALFNVSEAQSGDKSGSNKTLVIPVNQIANHFINPRKKPGQLDLTDMVKDVDKDAKLAENERLQQVIKYNQTKNPLTTGKKVVEPQKKSVTSGTKSGGLKPTGDL